MSEQDDPRPEQHPAFAAWLLENFAHQTDTPLGMFARDYAPLLPATDDRAQMRAAVEAAAAERGDPPTNHPAVDCFDVAWQMFRPTCEAPDCTNTVDLLMSLCAVHAPLEEIL